MKQKGSAIYLSLSILMIVLGIILGLSRIMVSQTRMIGGMEHSVVAFYAADSGVEEGMSLVQSKFEGGELPYLFDGEVSIGDKVATYQVLIEGGLNFSGASGSCQKSYYCIKAEGDYLGVKRAIEVGG